MDKILFRTETVSSATLHAFVESNTDATVTQTCSFESHSHDEEIHWLYEEDKSEERAANNDCKVVSMQI